VVYLVHPTVKKQGDIQENIRSYLASGQPRKWKELCEKASADGISKTTLSRYLKEFVKRGSHRRDVDLESYPPRVSYRLNKPQPLRTLNEEQLLEKQLAIHMKYAAQGEHGAISYYDKFVYMLFDMIAIHVWGSRFQNAKIAAKWIRVMTEMTLNDEYKLGHEASVLMKHPAAIHDSARDYLLFLLKHLPKGRLAKIRDPKYIEEYFAFDPTPTIRQMKESSDEDSSHTKKERERPRQALETWERNSQGPRGACAEEQQLRRRRPMRRQERATAIRARSCIRDLQR